jgi:hypothetical protein
VLSSCNPTLRRVDNTTSQFTITGSGFEEASTIELHTEGVDSWECTNAGVNSAGTVLTVDALCHGGGGTVNLATGPAQIIVDNDGDSSEGEFEATFIDE